MKETIINLVRRLLGLPPGNIGAITKPIGRIVRDLHDYSDRSQAKAEYAKDRASYLKDIAADHDDKAAEARRLASVYNKLLT